MKIKTIAIMSLLAFVPPAYGALTANLLAYYDFEGNANNSSLATGGTSYDGVLSGNATTTGGTARSGTGALNLDGNGDYMTVSSLLNLNASWTISAWFKSDIVPTTDRQFVFESYKADTAATPNNTGYGMSYGLREGTPTTNSNFQTFTDLTGTDLSDDTQILDSASTNWHNIVLVYTAGGNLVSYLNGAVDASLAIPNGTFVAGDSLRIGTYRVASGRYFDGSIDDVAIWDRALTVNEINNANTGTNADSVYQLGLAGISVPEPSTTILGGLGILVLFRRRRK